MKQVFIIAFSACVLSCNTASTTKTDADSASTATAPATDEKVDYAYTIEHPDNWDIGDKKNTATVLKALKAYETGDVAASMAAFGDSVKLEFDGFDQTLPHDSLVPFFTRERARYKDLTIKMEDWESVISKDKKIEYVSLWYKEIMTDQKGKVDSIECMDDLRMKDGKILSINEKTRHYGAKK
jgi:hypothetical protein